MTPHDLVEAPVAVQPVVTVVAAVVVEVGVTVVVVAVAVLAARCCMISSPLARVSTATHGGCIPSPIDTY